MQIRILESRPDFDSLNWAFCSYRSKSTLLNIQLGTLNATTCINQHFDIAGWSNDKKIFCKIKHFIYDLKEKINP